MSFRIPDKIYFKIGEVSKLAEVAPHVIRYWESEFDQIAPKRAGSNQRLYKRDDVELILKIKTLLHIQGYTIAGARKFLQSGAEIVEEQTMPDQAGTQKKLHRIKSELLQLYKQLKEKK